MGINRGYSKTVSEHCQLLPVSSGLDCLFRFFFLLFWPWVPSLSAIPTIHTIVAVKQKNHHFNSAVMEGFAHELSSFKFNDNSFGFTFTLNPITVWQTASDTHTNRLVPEILVHFFLEQFQQVFWEDLLDTTLRPDLESNYLSWNISSIMRKSESKKMFSKHSFNCGDHKCLAISHNTIPCINLGLTNPHDGQVYFMVRPLLQKKNLVRDGIANVVHLLQKQKK